MTQIKWLKASALLGIFVVLGACALVRIPVDSNVLGLDGQTVDMTVTGTSSIATQAVASGTATGSFSDIETSITPGFFEIDQALDETATVSVPSGELPAEIELSDLTLSIFLSDASSSTTIDSFTVSGTATLTLTTPTTIAPAQSSGTYDVSSVSFGATLTGGDLAEVNPIITGGGTNNVTATITATTTSSPDLPVGSVITLGFGVGSGTVGP